MSHHTEYGIPGLHVECDLAFAQAPVGFGTERAGTRALLLDVYAPGGADAEQGALGRPALVLSHGGAYHRGSKEQDLFEQDGFRNTPVAEYCRHFAARGHVCFSVGYRLTQERPAPQPRPVKRNRTHVSRERIDHVRGILGLEPATEAELIDGSEGAFADVAAAFRFVHANAARWGIDPQRIALGGFSAGAFASAYAAYALGVPAAAVVALSGGMEAEDAEYYVHGARGQPPLLAFVAEHDLPSIPERTQALVDRAERAGLPVRRYQVPGRPHFYDRDSPVVLVGSSLPGGVTQATVVTAIEQFLAEVLVAPRVDVAALEAFADAWNRHDLDALMSFMTVDCIFHAYAGADAAGMRHVGHEAVRAAFARAWAEFPDAQWTRARHCVAGQRGSSEWTFVGTRERDGVRLEVDGCDLFTFRGDKIRVKDSWRKQSV